MIEKIYRRIFNNREYIIFQFSDEVKLSFEKTDDKYICDVYINGINKKMYYFHNINSFDDMIEAANELKSFLCIEEYTLHRIWLIKK
jgi:hypothetical protein